MLTTMQTFEGLLTQINQLPPEYRIKLIQRVSASLHPLPVHKPVALEYGKYRHNRMSEIEDFAIAEWHPTSDLYDDA